MKLSPSSSGLTSWIDFMRRAGMFEIAGRKDDSPPSVRPASSTRSAVAPRSVWNEVVSFFEFSYFRCFCSASGLCSVVLAGSLSFGGRRGALSDPRRAKGDGHGLKPPPPRQPASRPANAGGRDFPHDRLMKDRMSWRKPPLPGPLLHRCVEKGEEARSRFRGAA